MSTTKTETTNFQICARPIKSKNGTIAHHGYKRPGQGWQTASCFGTHYRPYEVACDRIQAAINDAQAFKTRRETNLTLLMTEPPATLTGYRHSSTSTKKVPFEVNKPEGFDPSNPSRCFDHRPLSYSTAWQRLVNAARADITGTAETIEFLQARLAAWKPPVEAAA